MRNQVANTEWLYRRGYAPPDKRYMNPDGSPTSRVFKLRDVDKGELSVDVKSLTTAEVSIKDQSKFLLFEILVEHVSALGIRAEHDPLPNIDSDEINPAHAVIVGMDIKDDIIPGQLARKAKRVII
jgi:hypothetical protein